MQSVLVLPLVMPLQADAAVEPVPPSEGAFQLTFDAEEEKGTTLRDGGDPSPMGVLAGVAFPLALTFPVVPEGAEAGPMVGPALGHSVGRGPEMIVGAETEGLAGQGNGPQTAPALPDLATAIDMAPPGIPLAKQMIEAARADVPEGLRGGLPPVAVGGVVNVQPDAPAGTPARPTSPVPDQPLPGSVVPDAQTVPTGPAPQARAVESGEATVPATPVSQPSQKVPQIPSQNLPLTGIVPVAAQQSETVRPQPIVARAIPEPALSAPDRPTPVPDQHLTPANNPAVATKAAVGPVVAERQDDVALVQTDDRPAGPVAAVEPSVLPAAMPLDAKPVSPSSDQAAPVATGSLILPTQPAPAAAPDPVPSSAAQDASRPGVVDKATAPPAPVQPPPSPLPGFWERLFSGLVATESDPAESHADAGADQGPSDTPSDATVWPRDTKTTAPTLPTPAEPAAVALFARDQSQAWRQEADVATDELPAGALALASASGPLAAMPAMSQAAPVNPTSLPVPQVAGQIAAALSRTSDGATELALSPEELGHVRLKLERDARHPERMIVHITFERPETMDLFRRHAGDLAEALRQAGFAGADIGFGQQGAGDHGFNRGEESRTLPGAFAGGSDEPQRPEPSPQRLMAGASLDLRL